MLTGSGTGIAGVSSTFQDNIATHGRVIHLSLTVISILFNTKRAYLFSPVAVCHPLLVQFL